MDVATETKTSATLAPVSAPTSTFHLTVVLANITTSIRYRQYCFAYHSSSSAEVGGVWGPAARRFFDGCLATANDARDVDFYHWSSQSFGEFWKDALSVLMARERARIGLAASEGDLSRRIVAYAYDDQEDSAAYT